MLAGVLILGTVIGIALIERSGSSINSPIAASPNLYEANLLASPLAPSSITFVQANASR